MCIRDRCRTHRSAFGGAHLAVSADRIRGTFCSTFCNPERIGERFPDRGSERSRRDPLGERVCIGVDVYKRQLPCSP